MAESGAEKTEPASDKRRQDFREKGEVARSKDIISVLIMFSGVVYFMMFGGYIYERLGNFLKHFFTLRQELEFEIEVLLKLFIEMIEITAYVLGPLVAIVVLGN
jgi:flagellar biosynthetic protein FlhB